MKIALHGLSLKQEFLPDIKALFRSLEERNFEIHVTQPFYKLLQKQGNIGLRYTLIESKKDMALMDFLISIGGDGTLLDAVCQVGPLEIPILGLNTGRLGFLATVTTDTIEESVEHLSVGNFQIEERSLVSLDCDRQLFDGINFGLNEFTVTKRDTSSMITVHTYVDGRYLNSYWADGLIVATPTGSTGYSLSCGGPLLSPKAKNLVITPVSPHNLNVRPMVVSDDSEISIEIEGRADKYLVSLDSRSTSVSPELRFKIKKEKFNAKLVKLPHYDFFDTLRLKLHWGLDMRN